MYPGNSNVVPCVAVFRVICHICSARSAASTMSLHTHTSIHPSVPSLESTLDIRSKAAQKTSAELYQQQRQQQQRQFPSTAALVRFSLPIDKGKMFSLITTTPLVVIVLSWGMAIYDVTHTQTPRESHVIITSAIAAPRESCILCVASFFIRTQRWVCFDSLRLVSNGRVIPHISYVIRSSLSLYLFSISPLSSLLSLMMFDALSSPRNDKLH